MFIFLLFSFYSVYKLRFFYPGEYNYVLLVTLICVFTDVGGYIFGKFIKGPKLTKLSPNKTYSGMIGAYLLSIILILYLFHENLIFLKNYELNLNNISDDDYAINIIGNSSNSIDPGIIAGLSYHQYFGKGFLGINFTYIPSKNINYEYSWVRDKYYISEWNELEEVDVGGNIIFLVTGTNF